MSEQVHGHEVMKMMVTSGKSYTKESLAKEIIKKFGAEARFYTCSAENMTADELIGFLEMRGKFVDTGKGFSTDPEKICDH
jgi:probable metal-binding protein